MSIKAINRWRWAVVGLLVAASGVGCGGGVFNEEFVNSVSGGVFPLTPGPPAAFILVRGLNETGQDVEFIITYDAEDFERDGQGNVVRDDNGVPVTRTERTTSRLFTFAASPGNDMGILIDCAEARIERIGLGENLLSTDAAVSVGGVSAQSIPGFGVPAGRLAPLELAVGNYNCGDTVIFQAFTSGSDVGLRSLVLPASEQPSEFAGPSTFLNYRNLLESQIREEEP